MGLSVNKPPQVTTIPIVVDGGGQILVGTLDPTDVPLDYASTLLGWTLIAAGSESGTVTVDLQKAPYGTNPTFTSMVGAGTKPNLTSQRTNQDTTLASWTTKSIAAGDILRAVVQGTPAVVTKCTLALKVRRTV